MTTESGAVPCPIAPKCISKLHLHLIIIGLSRINNTLSLPACTLVKGVYFWALYQIICSTFANKVIHSANPYTLLSKVQLVREWTNSTIGRSILLQISTYAGKFYMYKSFSKPMRYFYLTSSLLRKS
jgi:hypothetical protein